MTTFNILTTIVTLIACGSGIVMWIATANDRTYYLRSLETMTESFRELSGSLVDTIETHEKTIKALGSEIELLKSYRKAHALRLNTLEDLVDLLNHDAYENIVGGAPRDQEAPDRNERMQQIMQPQVEVMDLTPEMAERLASPSTRLGALLELDDTAFSAEIDKKIGDLPTFDETVAARPGDARIIAEIDRQIEAINTPTLVAALWVAEQCAGESPAVAGPTTLANRPEDRSAVSDLLPTEMMERPLRYELKLDDKTVRDAQQNS